MAKESRKLTAYFLEKCYKNGFIHSFIVNSCVLLALAIIVTGQNITSKPIRIDLSTEQTQEHIDLEKFAKIQIDNLEVSSNESKCLEINISTPDDTEESYDFELMDIQTNQKSSDLLHNISTQEYNTQLNVKIPHTNNSVDMISDQSDEDGSEMNQRLIEAGAKTGDVQISIAWDNFNDIDVWVVLENKYGRFCINWMNKIGPNNGYLDIDMNVQPTTNRAVENIFWPPSLAPEGKYSIYVQNYQVWDKRDMTGVRLRVINPNSKKPVYKKLSVSSSEGVKKVYSFYYKRK